MKKYVLQVPVQMSKSESDELTTAFNEWLRSYRPTVVLDSGATVVELDPDQ